MAGALKDNIAAVAGAGRGAYATLENAGLGASRFVGPVEIRGAGGHVWLYGRRIPTWWLWVRGGGRVTGFIWRMVMLWWELGEPGSLGRRQRSRDTTTDVGDLWTSFETRPETVSWRVSKSRLVSSGAVARTLVSDVEATLPMRMGLPWVKAAMAKEALEKSRTSTSRIQLEVPIGRGGGTKQLYLEVPSEGRATMLRVLSGYESIAEGSAGAAAQDGGAEAAAFM